MTTLSKTQIGQIVSRVKSSPTHRESTKWAVETYALSILRMPSCGDRLYNTFARRFIEFAAEVCPEELAEVGYCQPTNGSC